ncbi:MAG: hypothetical protein AcusKO_08520 [Acuticoccus sp.]
MLAEGRRAVFATLSARVGSIGDNRLGGWYGYRAAKAALNQIVRCAAIEIARRRPEAIVLALHPGTVATTADGALSRPPPGGGAGRGGGQPHRRARRAHAAGQRRLLRLRRVGDRVVAPRLVLVLGDQLSPALSALAAAAASATSW